MRNKLWVVIGVALGLLTAILVSAYIQQEVAREKRKLMVGREPTQVLVAVADIPAQAPIGPDMVGVDVRPADAIQPKALGDPGEAIGKIALAPFYQGEQILDSKLATPENANTLSQKIPPTKRAITIDVTNITGVGGFIHPGDFVDILGLFSLPAGDGREALVTVTLLQRIAVLASGDRFAELQAEGSAPTDTLTLALTPQETEIVLFAKAAAREIKFSLRPRVDSEILADLKPMSMDALAAMILGPQMAAQAAAAPPPEPTPPPMPARQVEIFRGLEREVVALPE